MKQELRLLQWHSHGRNTWIQSSSTLVREFLPISGNGRKKIMWRKCTFQKGRCWWDSRAHSMEKESPVSGWCWPKYDPINLIILYRSSRLKDLWLLFLFSKNWPLRQNTKSLEGVFSAWWFLLFIKASMTKKRKTKVAENSFHSLFRQQLQLINTFSECYAFSACIPLNCQYESDAGSMGVGS